MKILIASDIHGGAQYCKELKRAYDLNQPDKILLLGDLLYHGPRNNLPDCYDTKITMGILNELAPKITCVRGNCDAEVDQMVLGFPVLNTYEMIETDGLRMFATHGHVYNPSSPPPFVQFDVMLSGHTHVSALEDRGEFYYVNPGSLTIPKGGTQHSYIIYENKRFTLYNLMDGSVISSIDAHKKTGKD